MNKSPAALDEQTPQVDVASTVVMSEIKHTEATAKVTPEDLAEENNTPPPHFDISAAVVRQLGEELVTDEVTAILELVKNAYDADADYAHVVVDTDGYLPEDQTRFPSSQGFITIEDNGMGMARSDIERGWLMISLSGKRTMKASGKTTPKGRTPLGDKGLGRLSTQKLGTNLEIYTRKDNTNETLRVSFSWASFTEENSLSSVPVSIEKTTAGARNKGTKLAITGLRNSDVWKGKSVDRLAADLSQIIFPFESVRPFRVTLKINGRPIDLEQISTATRKAAISRFNVNYTDGVLKITGKIRLGKLRGNQTGDQLEFFEKEILAKKGRDFYDYLLSRNPVVTGFKASSDPAFFVEFNHSVALADLSEVALVENIDNKTKDKKPVVPADPGPIECEIDEFLFRNDEAGLELSGLSSRNDLQKTIKPHVGIKVFRDGFGVRPYGLNGEDWLRLGAQQTSAGSWYGLRPQNIVGFVAISEKTNGHLKEKTDREGFVKTPYSDNFFRLMRQAASTIEDFYDWVRREYNSYRDARLAKPGVLISGKKAIQDANKVTKDLATFASKAKSAKTKSAAASARLDELSKRIEAEPLFSSPAERHVSSLMAEANEALRTSREIFEEIDHYAAEAEHLSNIVASLGPRLDVLNNKLQDFTELAGLGLLAESLSHEVLNQIDRLIHTTTGAVSKARQATPSNADLLIFAQEVTTVGTALRRQVGHLAPSLRYQRDKIEIFALSELISFSREYLERRWQDANIDFVVDGNSDFFVRTHKGRLTQVVDNILLNSEYWLRDALTKQAISSPSIFVQGDAPFLRIWDNGKGVDPSVEDSLFEPFVTLKPRDVGRGLGLYIAAKILDSMGCSITLQRARNSLGRRYIFELDLSGVLNDFNG